MATAKRKKPGPADPEKDGLEAWILQIAWKSQPRLIRALALISAAAVILGIAAGTVRTAGLVPFLLSFLLVGGLVLVVQGFLSLVGRRGRRPNWLAAIRRVLRGLAAVCLGTALVLTALLLYEGNLPEGAPRPVTGWATRLVGPAAQPQSCTPPADRVFVDVSPETVEELLKEGQFARPNLDGDPCKVLQSLRAVRFTGSFDWNDKGGREIWASAVEIPAGSEIVLGSSSLAIHAIELRGSGRIVAWPEDRPAASGGAPGDRGSDGAKGGELMLDLLGGGSGSLTVDLRGQAGGHGVRGQKGNKGSTGSRGDDAVTSLIDCKKGGGDGGRGGTGGKGGAGGDGGNGGAGGKLVLANVATQEQLERSLNFVQRQAASGRGGEGGEGGAGGDGGAGGGGKGHCGGGRSGPAGQPGPPGDPGQEGRPGSAPTLVTPGSKSTQRT